MSGKLYRLTARIETYYWSDGGGEPHDGEMQSAVAEAIKDAGADWIAADEVENDEQPLFGWDQDSLVYGNHEGDMTLAEAIARHRETVAEAEFQAKQGGVL